MWNILKMKIYFTTTNHLFFTILIRREGPVRGGTNITVSGAGFEDTGDQIKCDFNGVIIHGKFINP